VYIISVAAELAGVHPQTLRIYESKGLLRPARTAGNTRRYSDRDIERLRTIQRLTQEEGLNLAGVKMIVEMEDRLERLRHRVESLDRELERAREQMKKEIERVHHEYRRQEIVPAASLERLRQQLLSMERRGRAHGPIAVGPSSSSAES
jgi:MerR family transcriptional regulator, heat shock protein HspR